MTIAVEAGGDYASVRSARDPRVARKIGAGKVIYLELIARVTSLACPNSEAL